MNPTSVSCAVRVRPLWPSESCRRTEVIHMEHSAQRPSLVMLSDAQRFFQLSVDRAFPSTTPQSTVNQAYNSTIHAALGERDQLLLVIGGKDTGKTHSVFGPEVCYEKDGEVIEVMELGVVAAMLKTYFDMENRPGKLQVYAAVEDSNGNLLPLQGQKTETSDSIASLTHGLATLATIYRNRAKFLSESQENPIRTTVLLLEVSAEVVSKVAIVVVEDEETMESSDWESIGVSGRVSDIATVEFIRKSLRPGLKMFCLATLAPAM